MAPDNTELQTPWLRDQLIEWLLKLGDRSWLQENWASPGSVDLDRMLDFFDDTGVLDDPVGRIGFILRDEREAEIVRKIDSIIEQAIRGDSGGDVEMICSRPWGSVMAIAREALKLMAVGSSCNDSMRFGGI
ncbi:hypothetical protein [Streptomyces sp. NPDC017202]|uniref:SCO4402 family protein n=1 Tax=Streptomyces sp. NPDC017202 TaxID=3364981 RepID=UPI00378E1A21